MKDVRVEKTEKPTGKSREEPGEVLHGFHEQGKDTVMEKRLTSDDISQPRMSNFS